MPTLPKHHAPVREAVASILSPAVHLDHLYGAHQIADILNAAVGDSNEKGIDTTVLLRAFSNDAADAFAIPLPCGVLYVRRTKTPGRHGGNDLVIGRFKTMEEGERAAIVRWRVDISDRVRSGLSDYIRAQKRKRPAAEVSPPPVVGGTQR